jgi:hypothetical protein
MDPTQRADTLLATMTLDEKAIQLTSVMPHSLFGDDGIDPGRLAARLGNGIGQISGLAGFGAKPPADVARAVNQIQHFLVEKTRLGIPAIFHNEALNVAEKSRKVSLARDRFSDLVFRSIEYQPTGNDSGLPYTQDEFNSILADFDRSVREFTTEAKASAL